MKPKIALIGPGKVGCAIGRRLHLAGYPISAVIGRTQGQAADGCRFIGCTSTVAATTLQSVKADIFLLALKDDQIADAAALLSKTIKLSSKQTLIHFSGLHPAEVMRTAASSAALLSIHPLLPFADRTVASKKLVGCPCCFEGDKDILSLAKELIESIGGHAFAIHSENKALYHTAASMASNFLVTLLATASELLNDCGIPAENVTPLLLPLVQASVDNLARLGPEQGLTGPIVRGDCDTISSHLAAIEKRPELSAFYKIMAHATVELAVKSQRLPSNKAELLYKILDNQT